MLPTLIHVSMTITNIVEFFIVKEEKGEKDHQETREQVGEEMMVEQSSTVTMEELGKVDDASAAELTPGIVDGSNGQEKPPGDVDGINRLENTPAEVADEETEMPRDGPMNGGEGEAEMPKNGSMNGGEGEAEMPSNGTMNGGEGDVDQASMTKPSGAVPVKVESIEAYKKHKTLGMSPAV